MDMTPTVPLAVLDLVTRAAARKPLGGDAPAAACVHDASAPMQCHYGNQNARLDIDFSVEKIAFPGLQTMDPRLVRIAPGKNNEYHRHAHESVFVVLAGRGEVLVGDRWQPVATGDVAFVPRWHFHQTRNLSQTEPMTVLAITDFGFTSAVLGDYDKRTRLAQNGADVTEGARA